MLPLAAAARLTVHAENMSDWLAVLLLGIIEGVTEFLPVSSTGHLLLAEHLMKRHFSEVFNVVIQLGAILAVVVQYWRTFWAVAMGLIGGQAESWRFTRNLLIAFVPSVIVGLALHDRIEAMLGEPKIVAWALIIGGIAILAIERMLGVARFKGIADIPALRTLGIGFIQCLSMIPGVSRSGATIMGALALGVERRTAAEFSFFLAVPTMLGASTLELVKNRDALASGAANGWL